MLNKLSTKIGIVLSVLLLVFVVLTVKTSSDVIAMSFYTRYFQETSFVLAERSEKALRSFEAQLHLYESASQSDETYFLERAAQTGEQIIGILSAMKHVALEKVPTPWLFSPEDAIQPLMKAIEEESSKIEGLADELARFNHSAYSAYLSLTKEKDNNDTYTEVLHIVEDASSVKAQLAEISGRLNYNNVELISFIHKTAVKQESSTLSLFAVMSLLTLVGMAFILQGFFVFPIQKLRAALERMSEGSLKERVEINSSDEVGELAYTFNRVLDKIEMICKRMNGSMQHFSMHLMDSGQIHRSYYHNANVLNEISTTLNRNTQHADIPITSMVFSSFDNVSMESQELYQHVAAVNALFKKAAFLLKQFPERHTVLFQSLKGTHAAEFQILQKVIERLTFDIQKIEARVQTLSEKISIAINANEENPLLQEILEGYKDLETTTSSLQKQFATLRVTGLRIQDNTKELETVQAEFEHQSKELSSLFGWENSL